MCVFLFANVQCDGLKLRRVSFTPTQLQWRRHCGKRTISPAPTINTLPTPAWATSSPPKIHPAFRFRGKNRGKEEKRLPFIPGEPERVAHSCLWNDHLKPRRQRGWKTPEMEAEANRCPAAAFSPPPAPAVYVKALTVPLYQLQLQPLTLSIALAQPGPGKGHSSGAGRHLCPHCGRDCLKRSVLEKHVRSHTGERPFPCATCRVAFKTQSNLSKHRRTQTHVHNAQLAVPSQDEDEEREDDERRPADKGAVRKCESTDSGYLSHADSAELQAWPGGSPLQSPEAESSAGALEKRRLEEHIAKLISQNKALVDDTQLDNVRPRKTALSKQGSLDLPMPYTYKDSFHFDIKALDGSRKKTASFSAAKSTLTPLEKNKPLFFHSVPTQFSTTIDCVPVARSNSVPFVESTRMLQEKMGGAKLPLLTQNPLNNPFSTLLHSSNQLVEFPNSHPRGLVRQAAVDELHMSSANDYPPFEEKRHVKKRADEASVLKCKTASKKCSQKKLKMFSQEKWQIYGDETFKKLYQKMTNNESTKRQKQDEISGKALRASAPDQKKLAKNIAVGSVPSHGSLVPSVEISSAFTKTSQSSIISDGSLITSEVFPQITHSSFTELVETSWPTDPGGKTDKKTPSAQEQKGMAVVSSGQHDDSRSSSPTSSNALVSQLQQAPDPPSKSLDIATVSHISAELQNSGPEEQPGLNVLNLNLSDTAYCCGERNGQEGFRSAQMALHNSASHQGNDQESEKLPSERKKQKVEDLQSRENPPIQADSCKQDNSGRDATILRGSYNDSRASVRSLEGEGKKQTEAESDTNIGSFEDEKRAKNLSESLDCLVNLKHILDSANTLLPTFCSAFQAPTPLRENDQISTKHREGFSSYSLNHSAEEVGNRSLVPPAQNCLSTRIKHQDLGKESHPVEKTFSPKYLLKLPHTNTVSHSPAILKTEQEKLPTASGPIVMIKDLYSIPSASVSAGPAPVFQFALPSQSAHESRLIRDAYMPQGALELSMPSIIAPSNNILGHSAKSFDNKSSQGQESKSHLETENLNKLEIKAANISPESSSAGSSKDMPFPSSYTGSFIISSSDVGQNQNLQKPNCVFVVTQCSSKVDSSEHNKKHPAGRWQAGCLSPCNFTDPPQSLKYPLCELEKPGYYCQSFGSLYCHTVTTQQRGSSSLPKRSLTFHSGNTKVSTTKAFFPCLNTEPRITWCCLTRSLPLPAEQKQKAYSAYSSLKVCRRNADEQIPLPRRDTSIFDLKNTGKDASPSLTTGSLKTLVSTPFLGPQKQRENVISVAGSFAKEKGISCRNQKLLGNEARENDKLQKIKVTKNRYRRQSHGSAHFKAHWLCKQQRLPSKYSRPPSHAGQNQQRRCHFLKSRATAGMVFKKTVGTRCSKEKSSSIVATIANAGGLQSEEKAPGLQVEPCTAICHGDDHKTEAQENENSSGTLFSHSANSNHFREEGNIDAQDSSGSFEGMISELTPRTPAASSPQAANSLTYTTSAQSASSPQACVSLDICRPAALPSVLQNLLTAESMQSTQSDPLNSTFWPSYPEHKEEGRSEQQQARDPAMTDLISLKSKVKGIKMEILNVESQGHNLTALNPLQPVSGGKDRVNERHSSEPQGMLLDHRLTCTASGTVPERIHSQAFVEGGCAVSLHSSTEAPGRDVALSTSQAGREKRRVSQELSSKPGRHPEKTPTTSKARMSPFSLQESVTSSEKPLKTKKHSLELMRNQTPVEYNDSSSDDEGRLVIEIQESADG